MERSKLSFFLTIALVLTSLITACKTPGGDDSNSNEPGQSGGGGKAAEITGFSVKDASGDDALLITRIHKEQKDVLVVVKLEAGLIGITVEPQVSSGAVWKADGADYAASWDKPALWGDTKAKYESAPWGAPIVYNITSKDGKGSENWTVHFAQGKEAADAAAFDTALSALKSSAKGGYIVLTKSFGHTGQTLETADAGGKTYGIIGKGGERSITLSGVGALFAVRSGVTLVLDKDITLVGTKTAAVDAQTSLVNMSGGLNAALVIEPGAKITGNYNTRSNASNGGGGGAIEDCGLLVMLGGEIYDNRALYGGGIRVNAGGTFYMYGGAIHDNSVTTTGNGGGVYTQDRGAVIVLDGGTISANTGDFGGGIALSGYSELRMLSGEISGNVAGGFSADGSRGGGVYVGGSALASFTMSGGVIKGNSASVVKEGKGGLGGGVYVGDGKVFTKTGGIIYGVDEGANSNMSAVNGQAVYHKLSGTDFKLRNNTAAAGDDIDSANGTGLQ
jgi:hypothetical protein